MTNQPPAPPTPTTPLPTGGVLVATVEDVHDILSETLTPALISDLVQQAMEPHIQRLQGQVDQLTRDLESIRQDLILLEAHVRNGTRRKFNMRANYDVLWAPLVKVNPGRGTGLPLPAGVDAFAGCGCAPWVVSSHRCRPGLAVVYNEDFGIVAAHDLAMRRGKVELITVVEG